MNILSEIWQTLRMKSCSFSVEFQMYWRRISGKPGHRSLALGPVEESRGLGMHDRYLPYNCLPEIVIP